MSVCANRVALYEVKFWQV